MIKHGIALREGNEHKPYSLGFQDSYSCLSADRIFVGVICDGCSMRGNGSAKPAGDVSPVHRECARTDGFTRNQVGAALGAEVFSHTMLRYLSGRIHLMHFDFGVVLKKAIDDTLAFFGLVLDAMGTITRSEVVGVTWDRELFITDKLMFTLIGIASIGRNYWLFGVGDGCFGNQNSYLKIDTPSVPFIGYRLIDSKLQCSPVVHKEGNLGTDTPLWVASDGLIPVLENRYSRADFFSFVSDRRTTHIEHGVDRTNQAFRSNVLRKNQDILLADDLTVLVIKWETADLAFPIMMPQEWQLAKGLEKDEEDLNANSASNAGQTDLTVSELPEVSAQERQESTHSEHGGRT